MFSLLDQLLGIPMQVLEHVQLADDVAEALLSREGVLRPLLEAGRGLQKPQQQRRSRCALHRRREVNAAHLAAPGWSRSVQV